ncbi:hypothetical protein L6164_006565 [Bauhinia variegata]|uniref:Uncharacterized protein n=1 Tax=Bauhinia variegata TaxID=167791 RepID=A0ACB9PU66_BAUVA|nr:hypothetical protein L6164_006565 [Bauhinia variegata]
MELEALYSKLYDKYAKIKNKKITEFDQQNKEQEEKFTNFVSAAEELIEHLKNENDQLRGQINDLRSEVASIRLAKDDQIADYQRLLMEESKKYEALSEEVEKFRKLHREGSLGNSKNNNDNIPEDNQFMANSISPSRRVTRKRSRLDSPENQGRSEFTSEFGGNSEDDSVVRESSQNLLKETTSGELECHTKSNDQSGVVLEKNGSVLSDNRLIQALFEYVLGMKLSTDSQTGRMSISALHQSSGYSFSLTWISKVDEEEAELLYHALSLGTFERVAPQWMREDIMFSSNMCSIFFERVSSVIKLHH